MYVAHGCKVLIFYDSDHAHSVPPPVQTNKKTCVSAGVNIIILSYFTENLPKGKLLETLENTAWKPYLLLSFAFVVNCRQNIMSIRNPQTRYFTAFFGHKKERETGFELKEDQNI